MKPSHLLPLLFLTLSSCENESPHFKNHQIKEASNAAEWITTFEKHSNRSIDFGDHYGSLPPLQEWGEITQHLRNRKPETNDKSSLKENSIAKLMSFMLEEDFEKSAEILKASIQGTEVSPATASFFQTTLVRLGENADTSKSWINKNLTIEEDNQDYPEKAKKDWEIALAENRIDEGIAGLQKAIKVTPLETRLEPLAKLLKISKILNKTELFEKNLHDSLLIIKSLANDDLNSYGLPYQSEDFLQILSEENRWKDINEIVRIINKSNYPYTSESLLQWELRAILKEKGTKELLKELSDLNKRKFYHVEDYLSLLSETPQLGLDVFNTLSAEGKKEESETLLLYLIATNGDKDLFYAQLLKSNIELAKTFLPKMRAYNAYEERPLIWLAEIALAENDLKIARSHIEEAITLDPSDGDQGKETRMQAYDVLSRILHKEGDIEKAQFFKEVTKAIRLGEEADDYLDAGLEAEAIIRYRASLEKFSDAYCLQSRLAKTLAEKGDFESAVQHFEKAFELMPVSFGPVESHCFGCEGIFEDERVHPIAESIFTKLIAKDPTNPRTYYLMGLLFEEMGKDQEAMKFFAQAFELDPKYLNCANKLATLFNKHPNKLVEYKNILPKIEAITPYQNLPKRFEHRLDLKQAWIDADKLSKEYKNPLDLPLLTPPFPTNDSKPLKSIWISKEVKSLNGWSRSDLLRENNLFQKLKYL